MLQCAALVFFTIREEPKTAILLQEELKILNVKIQLIQLENYFSFVQKWNSRKLGKTHDITVRQCFFLMDLLYMKEHHLKYASHKLQVCLASANQE